MLGIFLGCWLIVIGTITISGAFAARRVLPDWWLLLLLGLAEVPLGVLALAAPGATLAALVTVAGIWAVVIGVMRIVLAFEVRRLPEDVDEARRHGAEAAPRGDLIRSGRLLLQQRPRRRCELFCRRWPPPATICDRAAIGTPMIAPMTPNSDPKTRTLTITVKPETWAALPMIVGCRM